MWGVSAERGRVDPETISCRTGEMLAPLHPPVRPHGTGNPRCIDGVQDGLYADVTKQAVVEEAQKGPWNPDVTVLD